MKRYIRTEDDYIIDTHNTEPFMIVDCYIDFNSGGRFKMINTADNIKELCDEFVIKGIRLSVPLQEDELRNIPITQIYGAIWAKGKDGEPILKSVAKMNKEGKFGLL